MMSSLLPNAMTPPPPPSPSSAALSDKHVSIYSSPLLFLCGVAIQHVGTISSLALSSGPPLSAPRRRVSFELELAPSDVNKPFFFFEGVAVALVVYLPLWQISAVSLIGFVR